MRSFKMCFLRLLSLILSLSYAGTIFGQDKNAVDHNTTQRCFSILSDGLTSSDFWPAMHAAEALTSLGKTNEVRQQLEKMEEKTNDDSQQCGIARELARTGDLTSISVLNYLLANPTSSGRVHAAESLFKLELGNTSQVLLEASNSSDPGLSLFATAALAQAGNQKALARVRKQLTSVSSTARRRAAWVLASVGDASDRARILPLLPHATEHLERAQLEHTLAILGDHDYFSAVKNNLNDPDPSIRANAALFAGKCPIDVSEELLPLLDDNSTDVRIRAAHTLLTKKYGIKKHLGPQAKMTSEKGDHIRGMASKLRPSRTVTYQKTSDHELSLHVFQPQDWLANDKRVCFLVVHGGGWTGGHPQRMYPIAQYFAQQGMVGISLQYRLLNSEKNTTVFDCVHDGRAAVRYIREHANSLGVDPERIVVCGASAGGHVAVGTALFNEIKEPRESAKTSSTPNALVLLYPVIDTSEKGYGQNKIGPRWQELSPLHQIRDNDQLPPTILFHGTADTVTPFAGANQFCKLARKAGNSCQLIRREGGKHGYLIYDLYWYFETLQKIEVFLAEQDLLIPCKACR